VSLPVNQSTDHGYSKGPESAGTNPEPSWVQSTDDDDEPGPSGLQSSRYEDQAGDDRKRSYGMAKYSVAGLPDDVIRMETGLPDMAMFKRVVGLVERFEGSIVYFAGWWRASC